MELANFFEKLPGLLAYSHQCIAVEVTNGVCRRFWIWLVLLVIVIAAVSLCKIIMRELRKIKDINLYQNKLAERAKLADEVTMNQVRWQAEASIVEKAEQDIAAQIRNAIKSKK